jgi:glyoxalase family protein
MATEIGYSVPADSLGFWAHRLRQHQPLEQLLQQRFGETVLPFQDPDGLNISLIVPRDPDPRRPWTTPEVKADTATKGFHSVTLTLKNIKPTADILTGVFGFDLKGQEGDRYRFQSPAGDKANIVDLVETPQGARGLNGGGTNHHVAFRVPNEEVQLEYREKILSRGLHITPKINRDYFYSLYFREPGGVLFELATDNPGFTVDEPLEELGTHLKLPVQYEPARGEIEKSLPVLHI